MLALALVASSTGLLGPPAPRSAPMDRRAVLGFGAAAAVHGLTLAPVEAADKNYITLAEYQKRKAAEKKDEELYGKFESLRIRAAQVGPLVRVRRPRPRLLEPPPVARTDL